MTALAETAKPKRIKRSYSEMDVDAALTALVYCSGNCVKAAAFLEEAKLDIPRSTLQEWKVNTKTEQYERRRQELEPKMRAEMADTHQGLLQLMAQLESEVALQLQERVMQGKMKDRDLSDVLKNTAIGTGIHSEKHLLYQGQPTQIVQREASEVLRELAAEGYKPEVVEAEVVSEEDVTHG